MAAEEWWEDWSHHWNQVCICSIQLLNSYRFRNKSCNGLQISSWVVVAVGYFQQVDPVLVYANASLSLVSILSCVNCVNCHLQNKFSSATVSTSWCQHLVLNTSSSMYGMVRAWKVWYDMGRVGLWSDNMLIWPDVRWCEMIWYEMITCSHISPYLWKHKKHQRVN